MYGICPPVLECGAFGKLPFGFQAGLHSESPYYCFPLADIIFGRRIVYYIGTVIVNSQAVLVFVIRLTCISCLLRLRATCRRRRYYWALFTVSRGGAWD